MLAAFHPVSVWGLLGERRSSYCNTTLRCARGVGMSYDMWVWHRGWRRGRPWLCGGIVFMRSTHPGGGMAFRESVIEPS